MDDKDLIELRAALIQWEKALETERACVIRVRKIVERKLPSLPARQAVTITPNDSIAGLENVVK